MLLDGPVKFTGYATNDRLISRIGETQAGCRQSTHMRRWFQQQHGMPHPLHLQRGSYSSWSRAVNHNVFTSQQQTCVQDRVHGVFILVGVQQ